MFARFSQYTLIVSSTYLLISQYHLIFHVFEHLGFIPDLPNPYVVELFVFSGVAGCLCYNAIRSGCMLIAIFPLLEASHVSSSDVDDTTL